MASRGRSDELEALLAAMYMIDAVDLLIEGGRRDLVARRVGDPDRRAAIAGVRAPKTPYILGRAPEAATALREARALFAGVGAISWLERSEALLAPVATAT